jgi:predicted RNA-binding Zn-ribbon protein involved in translation (DUF1610 family)
MTVQEDLIHCPSCRNDITVSAKDSKIQCETCDEEILLAGHMCPICSTYHEDDEFVCVRCGTQLSRICQQCRHVNWSGHETCINCGESLEILSQFVSQKGRSTADRLQEHMDDVGQLKQKEEAASVDRMSEMIAIEERRQREIRQRVHRRKQEERRVVIVVGAAIAFFILILIVLVTVGGAG